MCTPELCAHLAYPDRDDTNAEVLTGSRRLAGSQSSNGLSGSVCIVASHGHHDVHSHEAVLFPFVVVLIGCFLTHLQPRYKFFRIFPYTVWLFVLGIIIGVLDFESKHNLGNLSESISMWVNIDPHLLLYTFLPVLLFGDSMNVSYYDFKRCASQCIILAGPGVLAGTALMFVVSKHIFPYDWTTNEAAAFAAILSATDPVAVVALLNEMGASEILTMQIAGESLLNDGVAIVVWTLFFDMMLGKEYSILEIILKFCRLAGGGVAFGVLVGVISLKGLSLASDKLIHTDHLVQLALTFTAAYLSFFIGENELKVSGVLATIFAALTIGRSAWPVICSPETVKAVWHTGEFFGNTILFALCGLVFYQSTNTVQPVDWLWLLLLYFFGVVARAILFVFAYPFLNLVASSKRRRVTWKECVVMTWGGLRGAVGLAMALSMRSQLSQCGKQETGDRMVFFVGGFAGLTLLINASTCGILLEMLGLTQPPEEREKLLCTLQHELLEIARHDCVKLTSKDKRFAACKVEEVDKILVRQNEAGLHTIVEAIQPASKKGIGILVMGVQDVVNMKKANTSPDTTARKGVLAVAAFKLAAKDKPSPNSLLPPTACRDVQMLAATSAKDKKEKKAEIVGTASILSEIPASKKQGSDLDKIGHAHTDSEMARPTPQREGHWWWGFDPIHSEGDVEELQDSTEISDEVMTSERHFYLTMLRAQYEKQLKEDLIPIYSEGAMDLPSSIDKASDLTHEGLKDWLMLQTDMLYEPHSCIRHCLKIAGSSPYCPYAPVYTKNGKKFDLFSVVVFLDSHHLVCARLSQDRSLNSPCRRKVVQEAAKEVEEAHKFMQDNLVGPEKISIVRTKQLLAVLYARQRTQVYKWMERGIINSSEAEELIHPVHHSMKEVKDMCIGESGEIGTKHQRDHFSTSKKSKHSNLPSVLCTLFGVGGAHKTLDTE